MDSSVREKRVPKPTSSYSPDAYNFQNLKDFDDEKATKKAKAAERSRNVAVKGVHNKWVDYKNAIAKAASQIAREEHCIKVYQTEKNDVRQNRYSTDAGEVKEIRKSEGKIRTAKELIKATFQRIEDECKNDKVWEQLAESDEEGLVAVEDVLCSKCNGADTENNDILFCDHAGCYKAYHQLCLEPAIDLSNNKQEDDWFCWSCECIDESLDIVGELTGEDVNDWRMLFPELTRDGTSHLLGGGNGEEEEESEDEDYNPNLQASFDVEEEEEGSEQGSEEGSDAAMNEEQGES